MRAMRPKTPTRDDQILRRKQRAEKGAFGIRNVTGDPVFAIFEVDSESGRTYRVQVRSLTARENSCTCKHIEAVLLKLRGTLGPEALAAARPAGAQIFLGYGEDVTVRAVRPPGFRGKAADLVARHFDDAGVFRGDPSRDLAHFFDAVEALPPRSRRAVQVADEVFEHERLLRETKEDRRLLDWYLKRVRRGDRSFNLLARPMYPYQVQGLLHLAFNRRALLADDMGLGKTVQALAASVLLKEIKGIERALVVCPASLKHQWAREIERFSSLSVTVVQGPKEKRRLLYDDPSFFTVINYELTLHDRPVLERLRPDLVILDEAQRIRNWKTKTADAVKSIPSKYAFVLTGTPLENRLDDLYSIFQFIDPRILGPLWRFNERYFVLEPRKGGVYKIRGHKNLDELRSRIAPKVLRRTRAEVLSELPDRVDNTYFVEMTREQTGPYEDYKAVVAQLAARAEKRPLTPPEEKKLLKALVKMRILCNALELHDPGIGEDEKEKTCPKARELESLLQEQVVDAGRKALVFSQWEGMIDIAARRLDRMGLGWVKLSGSVPSARRGALLDRFREDDGIRVFLSTDAGSVGLNLQPASLVVNLDIPWNPAVLDQRVGRTHRIGQTETVNVVNLVAQGTIEERVLEVLDTKRNVFQGVFGMEGEAPSQVTFGEKGALVGRLKEVLDVEKGARGPRKPAEPARKTPRREEEPFEALADALVPRFRDRILLVSPAPPALGGTGKILVVVEDGTSGIREAVEKAAGEVAGRFGLPEPPACAVFDREGYRSLLALAGDRAGTDGPVSEAYRAPSFTEGRPAGASGDGKETAARRARARLERGRDRHAFGLHALEGGFAGDAARPLRQSLVSALEALMLLSGQDADGAGDPAAVQEALVGPGVVPEGLAAPLFLGLGLKPDGGSANAAAIRRVAEAAEALLTLASEKSLEALA